MKQGASDVEAPRFSKGQVNRAGVFLLELRERARSARYAQPMRLPLRPLVRRWSGGAACTHDRCRRSLRTCVTTC